MKRKDIYHPMLKGFAALLCALLMYPLLHNATLVMDYRIDREAYLEACENTDKPAMHCDGKCVLAQKLMAATDQEEPLAPSLIDFRIEFHEQNTSPAYFSTRVQVQYFFFEQSPDGPGDSIDHPPRIV